jgi:hypothetical protein
LFLLFFFSPLNSGGDAGKRSGGGASIECVVDDLTAETLRSGFRIADGAGKAAVDAGARRSVTVEFLASPAMLEEQSGRWVTGTLTGQIGGSRFSVALRGRVPEDLTAL